ncbi:MAG: DNA primase [Steroidobacteraceae bacterium]
MSSEKLLERLEGVKQTGPSRWLAKCPAHKDNTPSLSIRQLDDGRVLLHDFGGCDTQAVLDALGLNMSDLFEKRLPGTGPAGGFAPTRSRIPAADLLRVVDADITLCAILTSDFVSRGELSADDWRTFARAAARIGRVRDQLEGRP